MKIATIASAFLLVGVILVGSLSACTQSNTSEATQPETTAANPVNSGQQKADSTSSQAAQPVAEAATPASSAQPKATDAERAQKRDEVRKQVEAVLTPDEVQQLETKVKGGEKMRKALSELNLTAEQKTKIKDILKTAYPGRQKQSEKSSQ
jgi:flagellar basal body-associated protein FliL